MVRHTNVTRTGMRVRLVRINMPAAIPTIECWYFDIEEHIGLHYLLFRMTLLIFLSL